MAFQIYKIFNGLRPKACCIQQSRHMWIPTIKKRDEIVTLYYSLKERLDALNYTLKNPELHKKVDIGLAHSDYVQTPSKSETQNLLKEIRSNTALEKDSRLRKLCVNLEEVEKEWLKSQRPKYVKVIAEHFQIFNHLFGDFAYFYPVIPMNITYDFDEETLSPVYAGNLLKPKETSTVPNVQFNSDPNDLWTLILTNPDGNLYEEEAEVLHWFIGNIPGGNLKGGEEIMSYLQPFPPLGTGYHRYIFLLYKQERRIDFTHYKHASPCYELKKRTFKTYDFYKEFQDVLTPAGLSFFQSDWDSSLKDFFHNKLNMREPFYEYEFPPQYIAPPVLYPEDRQFNRYLDLHRDRKAIRKEILLKRLKKIHPFEGDLKLLPYPRAQKTVAQTEAPQWIRDEMEAESLGTGKFREMYKGDNRPFVFLDKRPKRPPYPIFTRRFQHLLDQDEVE